MQVSKRYASIIAGFIGNVVEWYDFALYGYMANIFSRLFFPENTGASLIATYGIFAAGFIMRPLGSGVFGWLGDTIGRSRTMMISVILMALPTFILGCLPTYRHVGILAPLLLILVRMVQGLSVGGEFSSSVTYLVETAPRNQRGLAGSWANTGSVTGMLLGSGVAAAVTGFFPMETVIQWAWRLPFWAGGILGLISVIMRRHLPRSEHFNQHHAQRGETSPLLEAFTTNRKQMVQGILFASAYGVLFYIPLVYLPEWLHQFAGMKLDLSLRINTFATAMLLLLIPVSGWVGDHLLRRTRWISMAMLLLVVFSWPLYLWLKTGELIPSVVTQLIFVTLVSIPLGSAPALFVELFPARDRLSGYSVSYNLGLGVVGGSTPMISTWLIEQTSIPTVPALVMTVMALLGLLILWTIKDKSREPLS